MKVLWVVNHFMKDIAEKIGVPSPSSGSWLVELSKILGGDPNMELYIIVPSTKDLKELKINNINYFFIKTSNVDRFINPSNKYKKKALEIIDKVNPDIIHLQGSEFAYNLAYIDQLEVPVVISIQGLISQIARFNYSFALINENPYIKFACKNALRIYIPEYIKLLRNKMRAKAEIEQLIKCSNIIGRTEWDRAHSYYLNPNANYYYLQETIRPSFFNKKWNANEMQRHTVFCGGGYQNSLKGLHVILNAASLLRKEFKDIKIVIVGPNICDKKRAYGYKKLLRNMIEKLQLQEIIRFTGKLDENEMAEEFSKANVYVMGSSIENSPNTLGESMCIGTPSIIPYVGGTPSIALDKDEGLFYRFGDVEQLAWQVRRVFENDELAEKLSNNARKKANDLYRNDDNKKELINIYENIVIQKSGDST